MIFTEDLWSVVQYKMKQFFIWSVVASYHGNSFKTPDQGFIAKQQAAPEDEKRDILLYVPQVLPLNGCILDKGILDTN